MLEIIYTGAFRFPAGDAAAARVLNNAKIFRKLGYEVIFLSWGGFSREEDRKDDGYYYEGFRYINTDDLRTRKVNPLKRVYDYFLQGRKSLRIIRNLDTAPAAIIAYNPSFYASLKLIAYCRRKKIALVSDLTEWYAPGEFPGKMFAPPAWLNEINMRVMQKFVRNKIVISRFLNSYYRNSNNLILPPLIDEDESKWKIGENGLPPGIPASGFQGIRLIYAGNPTKKDLLNVMLDAVSAVLGKGVKIQFLILGVSAGDLTAYSAAKEMNGFGDAVLPLGRVPQDAVPAYYAAADFSLIIRENDRKSNAGFPTKLAESMMGGCPVIANATSDIAAFITDGYDGFVLESPSEEELENSLSTIASLSRDQINAMKCNAKRSACRRLAYKSYIDAAKAFLHALER